MRNGQAELCIQRRGNSDSGYEGTGDVERGRSSRGNSVCGSARTRTVNSCEQIYADRVRWRGVGEPYIAYGVAVFFGLPRGECVPRSRRSSRTRRSESPSSAATSALKPVEGRQHDCCLPSTRPLRLLRAAASQLRNQAHEY